jgi:Protein of unknown function DUF2625
MKTLNQLLDADQGAWDDLQTWIDEANAKGTTVEVLAANRVDAERVLQCLQVTTRSYLGTVAYRTGGILVDGGWLRILGCGHERLPRDLCRWNEAKGGARRLQNAMLVADDIIGGFFAINGGACNPVPGNMFYLAPDTLEWEDLETNYGGFLHWAISGNLSQFYESSRWPGWEKVAGAIRGTEALSIYPFPWIAGAPIGERSRRAIPVDEVWGLTLEFQENWASKKENKSPNAVRSAAEISNGYVSL